MTESYSLHEITAQLAPLQFGIEIVFVIAIFGFFVLALAAIVKALFR